MEKANKCAVDFIERNEDFFALLGLAGISSGVLNDKDGLFMQFAKHCKENGISKEEALKVLSELISESNK